MLPSGQNGVPRHRLQPGRQVSSPSVSGSGLTMRSAAPARVPNRSKSVIGTSTGSRASSKSVITVPSSHADLKADGRSALPRIDPLTSGIPSNTNSPSAACAGWSLARSTFSSSDTSSDPSP